MESNLGEAWCFPATSALLPCLGFQVAVVKMKQTGQVYAMKIMNKWDMLKRGEVTAGLGVQGAEEPPFRPPTPVRFSSNGCPAGVVLPRREGCVGERGPALDHAAALRLPGRELPGEPQAGRLERRTPTPEAVSYRGVGRQRKF